MPVLETVAGVAAIVATFQGALSLYTAYKARREAQQRGQSAITPHPPGMDTCLALGGTRVQDEYDRSFARLGRQFTRGDEMGQVQLLAELVALQRSVIVMLSSALTTGQLDPTGIMLTSDARQRGAVGVLAQQFQRMAVAASIPPSMAPRPAPRSRNQPRNISSPTSASIEAQGPLLTPRRARSRARLQIEVSASGPLPKPRSRPRISSMVSASPAPGEGQVAPPTITPGSTGPLPRPPRTTPSLRR